MRILWLLLVLLWPLGAAAQGDGLPAGSEPLRPSELEEQTQQSFASIPPEYLDLSGAWEGLLGGQVVRALFVRDGGDLSLYTITITLPDETVLQLEAVFDGTGLRTQVRLLNGDPDPNASIGLTGALEEGRVGEGEPEAKAPATFAERIGAAWDALMSLGQARRAGTGAGRTAGRGRARAGGGGGGSARPAQPAGPSGRYALERDGNDWLLRSTGAPRSSTPAELAEDPTPVHTLRPVRAHDAIQVLALALGMWTEARDHPRQATRNEEMRRVGGIIINREQTAYRDKHSLIDVVLDRYQFSHFNSRSNPERRFLEAGDVEGLTAYMEGKDRWEEALALARGFIDGSIQNPWTDTFVRHYYSPRSMVPRGSQPDWVIPRREVMAPGISRGRFRWYRRIP